MIYCDTCPRCKDIYPDKLDNDGYHFCICGMSGNIVYKEPHKMQRYNGKGYIHLGISTCGLYETIDDILKTMTESERKRYEIHRKSLRSMDRAENPLGTSGREACQI